MAEEAQAGADRTADDILYETADKVASITFNRPDIANAQSLQFLANLDKALTRAIDDDAVSVIVLRGAGKHFSSGHQFGGFGIPEDRRRSAWYGSEGKAGAEGRFALEQEYFLGYCKRWRELPKPTIAAVQGACIAGGLMLAWVCDIIIAADDAFFSDPVVGFGIPGVEYFAHPFEMPNRIAREFLMTGDRMSAARAYEVAMVNRVVARDSLWDEADAVARKIAEKSRFALALTKHVLNFVEDAGGRRTALDGAFALHHLAHAHSELVTGRAATIPSPSKSR
jgi:enoyl-CoA hydratase